MAVDLDAALKVEDAGVLRTLTVQDLLDTASAREATLATRASEATLAAVEAALAQIGTELGQKVEPADLAALARTVDAQAIRDRLPAAGAATELGQKVEPADLAPLATGARQDAAKATLDAIAGALAGGPFATATGQGDLLAAVARDVTLQAVRDRVGDPAGPAAGTLLARIEQLRALLSGTLTVDTELSAAGPLATEAKARLRRRPGSTTARPLTGCARPAH
jgi:hypothetical protein